MLSGLGRLGLAPRRADRIISWPGLNEMDAPDVWLQIRDVKLNADYEERWVAKGNKHSVNTRARSVVGSPSHLVAADRIVSLACTILGDRTYK